jgi:hypothetical protein
VPDTATSELPEELRARLGNILVVTGERYLESPLPDHADDEVGALVESVTAPDQSANVAALRRQLARAHIDVFAIFAHRMAMLAVREQSVARLRIGLLAYALGPGAGQADWYDVSTDLLPLSDAALRIRGDSRQAFADAARLAEGRTAQMIRWGTPPRPRWLRWLMRARLHLPGQPWKAVEAPDGFRYVVANPMSEEEFLQKIGRTREGGPPRNQ